MKLALVGYGSTGDLLPLLALAVGLRTAGHEVVAMGDESGAGLAARHGLEFHALEGNLAETMKPGGALAATIDAGHFTLKSLKNNDAHDRARLASIEQAAQGADIVIGMPMAHYHALAVARDIGAHPILAVLQPLAPTRAMAPAGIGMPGLPAILRRPVGGLVQAAGWTNAKKPLNEARRAAGRSPIEQDPTRDAFTLCAWSPALVSQPDDWPADRFAVTGRWHLGTDDWTPDAALAEFLAAGEPPVYIGFGSMQSFSGMRRLLDSLLSGLASRRIVLAGDLYPNGRNLPANVHRLSGFVPHDWLFPRCAAVVHHCGAGTSHEALASGVPSIPVPISMDQPFWADRLYRRGVAARPLNPRKPSAALVRQAISVAESESVKNRAAELAMAVASDAGIQSAVRCLEGFK